MDGIKNNGSSDVYIVKYDKDVNVDVKFIRIFNINKKKKLLTEMLILLKTVMLFLLSL